MDRNRHEGCGREATISRCSICAQASMWRACPGGADALRVFLVTPRTTALPPSPTALPPSTPVPRVSATIIDGVALNPIAAGEWKECQQVADATRASGPCPTLLPVPVPLSCAALSELQCGRPAIFASESYFVVNQYDFVVPPGHVGFLSGSGHFIVMSPAISTPGRTRPFGRLRSRDTARPCLYCRYTRHSPFTTQWRRCMSADKTRGIPCRSRTSTWRRSAATNWSSGGRTASPVKSVSTGTVRSIKILPSP